MSLHDLAFAGRTLRKSPVFALTAALTIALGVGASTAIFSVTNAVLLRPLPYKDADQLVIIPTDMRNRGVKDFPFSNANFIDLREATKNEFQGLAGVFTFPFTLTGADGKPEQVQMGFVTTNYFRLVGARILFGRDFSDDDGQPQPPPPPPGTQSATPPQRLPLIAIISYEYFQRQFGSNPAVLGQSLNKGKPFSPRIVGVLAPHFQIYFPPSADLEAAPEIWVANRLGYNAEQRNFSFAHSLRQRGKPLIGASFFAPARACHSLRYRCEHVGHRPPDPYRGITARSHRRSGRPRHRMARHSRTARHRSGTSPAPRYDSNRPDRANLHCNLKPPSGCDLRAGAGVARGSSRRNDRSPRHQPQRRPRERWCFAQDRRRSRSRSCLCTPHWLGTYGSQLSRITAHRSRVQPSRPAHLSSSVRSISAEAGRARRRYSSTRRSPARYPWRSKRNCLKSLSAYGWLQPNSLGHGGSARGRQQI